MTKLNALANDKFKVAKMTISLFNRVENTEKRRKCWLPAYSPFPTVFSKAFFISVLNDCVVKRSGVCTQQF